MGGDGRICRFGRLLAILSPVPILLLGASYLLVGDGALWSEWLTIWPALGWGVLFLVRALMLWIEGYRRLAAATDHAWIGRSPSGDRDALWPWTKR